MRKPPGMSFETFIDRQIREAQSRGQFDNLPGKGRPVEGLDKAWSPEAWLGAKLKREGLSAPLPAVLELRKQAEERLRDLLLLEDEEALCTALDVLQAWILKRHARALEGPRLAPPRLDKAAILRLWREQRGG